MHAHQPTRLVAVVAATVALLAGCSGAASSPSAGITVTDAWGRSSSAMASAEAVYATITNAGSTADALIGASSPAARTVEVHETVVIESSMPPASAGMGDGGPLPSASAGMGTESTLPSASGAGMMGMQPVARVEIAAGGSLQLKPGGYHVMLIGLVKDLKAGDTIDVTFRFERAGEITVKAQVRES